MNRNFNQKKLWTGFALLGCKKTMLYPLDWHFSNAQKDCRHGCIFFPPDWQKPSPTPHIISILGFKMAEKIKATSESWFTCLFPLLDTDEGVFLLSFHSQENNSCSHFLITRWLIMGFSSAGNHLWKFTHTEIGFPILFPWRHMRDKHIESRQGKKRQTLSISALAFSVFTEELF